MTSPVETNDRDWTDSVMPSEEKQTKHEAVTDDTIRLLLSAKKLDGDFADLEDYKTEWSLGTFSISKLRPTYGIGWTLPLQPASRLYKRWFEFHDLAVRGWAIIFRIADPVGEPTGKFEVFVGWVPPERERDADRWIAFLNAQIHDRLVKAGKTPQRPDSP